MFRSVSTVFGSRFTTLWSLAKTAVVTAVLIRFGPLLLSLPFVGWSGVPFVASMGILTRIPKAIETVREERSRTESERVAFERFAAEIRDLDATDDPGAGVNGTLLRDTARPAGDSTETVRTLYRETVMSVEHYEAEYDEPFRANIAAELGPDLGTAVTANDALDGPLQRALARASDSAARDRAEFESLVESELGSLTDAEDRLRNAADTVDRVRARDVGRQGFEGLEDAAWRLQTAEQECESLIADRQTEYVDAPEEDGLNFREYLYQEHDWTHPVVGDALDVIRSVREAERRLVAAVFGRL